MSLIKNVAKLTVAQVKIPVLVSIKKYFIDFSLPRGSGMNVSQVLIGLDVIVQHE